MTHVESYRARRRQTASNKVEGIGARRDAARRTGCELARGSTRITEILVLDARSELLERRLACVIPKIASGSRSMTSCELGA